MGSAKHGKSPHGDGNFVSEQLIEFLLLVGMCGRLEEIGDAEDEIEGAILLVDGGQLGE